MSTNKPGFVVWQTEEQPSGFWDKAKLTGLLLAPFLAYGLVDVGVGNVVLDRDAAKATDKAEAIIAMEQGRVYDQGVVKDVTRKVDAVGSAFIPGYDQGRKWEDNLRVVASAVSSPVGETNTEMRRAVARLLNTVGFELETQPSTAATPATPAQAPVVDLNKPRGPAQAQPTS